MFSQQQQQQQQQQDFGMDNSDHNSMFINTPRSGNNFDQPQASSPYGMSSTSFGPMAIHPSNNGGMSFTDPSSNWFSTSMDSNGSSFGQSPVFGGRDLLITPSNSTGHIMDTFAGNEDDDLSQRNHQEIFEKRRRRRESHNAVERRRRDNINERIQELSTLLPDHLLESVPASSNVMTVTTGQNGTNGKPINKGTILKLSVDHIKELKEEVVSYKNKIQELEHMIELAKKNGSVKQEDLYNHQVLHSMMNTQTSNRRHERMGSIQFQQQFGKLHINSEEQQQQQA